MICPVCSTKKSQRECLLENNSKIRFLCCMEKRDVHCMRCRYYKDPCKYELEQKAKEESIRKRKEENMKLKPGKFIKIIDPKVDEKVDEALELAANGNYSKAQSILDSLLLRNTDIDNVHYSLGTLDVLQWKDDTTLKHFEKALQIYPYHAYAWFNKGVIHKTKIEGVTVI